MGLGCAKNSTTAAPGPGPVLSPGCRRGRAGTHWPAHRQSSVRSQNTEEVHAVRRTMRPSTWTQGVVKLGLGRVTAGMVMLVEDRAQSTEHRAQRTGEPAFGHSVADLLSPSPVRPYGHSAGRRVPSALRQRRHSPRQRRQHLHSTSQLRQQGRRAATAPRRSQLAPT